MIESEEFQQTRRRLRLAQRLEPYTGLALSPTATGLDLIESCPPRSTAITTAGTSSRPSGLVLSTFLTIGSRPPQRAVGAAMSTTALFGGRYSLRCASCVRDLTPSLRNALCRWYSTVLGLMKS